ncbi:MAG: hypothetical protein [Bacteriophage sp.]|jgi:hypothetical protein|nr:MAG: hypothetical protein [Bacteriophage sp.]
MFCLYGWLYILLFLIALVGALHGSIRIGKVALIVWGIIQTMAARIHPFPELSNVAEKTHSY